MALLAAQLDETAQQALRLLLQRHELSGLVTPHLPLDLTPMAGPSAFTAAVAFVLEHAAVMVAGLVPFTRQLDTTAEGAAKLARLMSGLRGVHRKPIAVVVDTGADYAEFRRAFAQTGLPVFASMEAALRGLRVLN